MITHARIHFNDSGTPVADDFDDVYFSNDNGLAESDYVFYQHNHISERLISHPRDQFVIAETGFGTGLNFLNAWRRFDEQQGKRATRLHFISFEKFPIAKSDLAKTLAQWPELAKYSEQLLQQYPEALAGCHRLHFANVSLDLWIGDVHDSLAHMNYPASGWVDAWFLDGFAPSKNPDMWQDTLFNAMADLGRDGATCATFTAAGFVRRGLINAGFEMKKVKGFGHKREMLAGTLAQANTHGNQEAAYQRPARALQRVAIIGGGIATASVLQRLNERQIKADIFCADAEVAMGASHNRQGAIYPLLQADVSPSSELFAQAFSYAKRIYTPIIEQHQVAHQWCGVLLQSVKEEMAKRAKNLIDKNNWPHWLIHAVDPQQASDIAGIDTPYGGLYIPQAGWVNPQQLVQAMITESTQQNMAQLYLNTAITGITKDIDGWQLHTEDGGFAHYSDVIICMGEHSNQLLPNDGLPLQSVRGQVSHLQSTEQSQQLKTVLCHKGYFTPTLDGEHCMGATFEKDSQARDVREDDDATNLSQLLGFYSNCQWTQGLSQINGAKAAIRATLPDHLPLIGQYAQTHEYMQAFPAIPNGVWQQGEKLAFEFEGLHVFTGLGARGLCTAPLCAETFVASLLDEPTPVSTRVDQALHPARFILRKLKRGQIQ